MQRPDLHTRACGKAAGQLFRRAGASNLVIRQGYGHDQRRLWHCRSCGAEFSERCGTAVCNTKPPEATAEGVISHLGEGCRVRGTARLVHVAKETVARLLRVTGRHAERCHDQPVPDRTPQALAFDEQGSFVQKSRKGMRVVTATICANNNADAREDARRVWQRPHSQVSDRTRGLEN